MKKKHCKACGAPGLKFVRATVVRSEAPPRIGLVCKHCARCGVLVVPAALKILPARPRKVARGELTRMVRQQWLDQVGGVEGPDP